MLGKRSVGTKVTFMGEGVPSFSTLTQVNYLQFNFVF